MAQLRGGPASGLEVDDERDVIWVAWQPNSHGKPEPVTRDDGTAQTLPDGVDLNTAALLNRVAGHWACYRKVGADTPDIPVDRGQELPYPPEGRTAYHWVCKRR